MHISSKMLFNEAVTKLLPLYDTNEARSIAFLLLQHLYGVDKAAVLSDKPISMNNVAQWQESLTRLVQQEPLQYVVGETTFYGLPFKVNPSVLIPRPETEELVDWIIREQAAHPIRILDIGTGSGCIAISLAKSLPQTTVWALDVSREALAVARQNAELNQVAATFIEANILQWEEEKALQSLQFDVVVSNPPYVTMTEKSQMHANVIHFEPHLALFVPDDDPLRFYRRIAQFCHQHLVPGGACYLEINEQFGPQTEAVLQEAHLTDTYIYTDLFGKARHVKASLKA